MHDRVSRKQVQLCMCLHYFEWIKAAGGIENTAVSIDGLTCVHRALGSISSPMKRQKPSRVEQMPCSLGN